MQPQLKATSQPQLARLSSFKSLVPSALKLPLVGFNVFTVVIACLLGGDCHNQKREKDKENYPSRFTPPSFKRRRLQPSASCHFEMTDSNVPVLSWSLEEQEEVLARSELCLTAINN